MNQSMRNKALLALAGGMIAMTSHAAEVTYSQPTYDRWVYPFNTSSGIRNLAPTFSAGFTPGVFDDADGQFYSAFNTAADFTPGQGADNYQVTRVSFTATTRLGGFSYDPTYDSYQTYGTVPSDADAGRPVHLFGTGFRNGFTPASFTEFGPYALTDPTLEGVRNVYAADVSAGGTPDISNFVRDGFEVNPLATGEVAGLAAGDSVADNTTFTFEVDLSDPDVLAYFQSALNDGIVPLTMISLHPASEQGLGGEPTPQWITKDNFEPGVQPATLSITATVVPEPASLAVLGLGGLALFRRRR